MPNLRGDQNDGKGSKLQTTVFYCFIERSCVSINYFSSCRKKSSDHLKKTGDFEVACNSKQTIAKMLICHLKLNWEDQPPLMHFWRQTSSFPSCVSSEEMTAPPRICLTLLSVGTERGRYHRDLLPISAFLEAPASSSHKPLGECGASQTEPALGISVGVPWNSASTEEAADCCFSSWIGCGSVFTALGHVVLKLPLLLPAR